MNDTVDLRAYIAIALKWWWLFVLLTGIAAAVGYVESSRQPVYYKATATIMVGQSIQSSNPTTGDFYLSQQLGRTYAEIAQRQPVLQGVVDALQLGDSWQALRGRVTINQLENTQLLEITVTAASEDEAQITADEIAHQLIRLSPTELENQEVDETQRFVRRRLEDLQAKIEAGQARLASLEAAMSGSLSADQVKELQADINELEGLISGWENNHTQLLLLTESKRSPNYLALIEPAQSTAIRPKTQQNTLLAGVVGFLLAAGIVFLLEYLDDTLKSTDDLAQTLGLTSLGAVSRIRGKDYPDKLVTARDLFSPVAEAYRIIRSNIQFVSVDRPAKSIMVTSAISDEGKSITVANLGVVMAQAGLKTIIVDADLRRPVQHLIFQVPNNLGGLTDLLRAPASPAEINGYLRKTGMENLHLITSGVLPPNPSELLGSQRMGQLLAGLEELADVVIYDSPPALAVADAAVLSNRVDGVVLVAEAGQTRRDAARQAILNLQQADASLLGGVLNRVSDKRSGYYYYYHSYSPNGHGPAGQPARARSRRRRQWLPFL